jgi:hypothetical protein
VIVKRYFGRVVTDPHQYDLVLNMSRVSVEDGAELIIQILHQFEGRGSAASVKQVGPDALWMHRCAGLLRIDGGAVQTAWP